MKCRNCGADLLPEGNTYRCQFCGVAFAKEEVLPITVQNQEYRIVSGVLSAYYGNQPVVTIPSGVYQIGEGAFKNNITVQKVIFSETVNTIEVSAFEGCANLTEISNYSGVTKFADDCFKFAGLTTVTIGRNVLYLGRGCFSRMPNLTTVSYYAENILKLNATFAYCPRLVEVVEDCLHFFPSLHKTVELLNNPDNKRPTYGDAFAGTPFIQQKVNVEYIGLYKKGICPECGGSIKKGLFHAKCNGCGIDYRN